MTFKKLIIAGLLGLVLFFTLTHILSLFNRPLTHLSPEFIIHPHESSRSIAKRLEKENLIPSALAFRFLIRVLDQGRSLKAGHYQFIPGDTPSSILTKITSGNSLKIALTIPEGLTVHQTIAHLLAQKGVSTQTLKESLETLPPLQEASLFPETYHFHLPVSLPALLSEMQRMAQEIYAPYRRRPLPSPLTSFHQALTLASIVEKETNADHERPLVARVFLNRLKKGMPLQADPTVAYAASQGKGLDRPLTQTDLKTPHPYNTYVNRGLPPGPICAPGRKSLEAIFSPAQSNALYFVSDGQSGHHFAATLRQHNRNVARYRRNKNL